MRRSVRASLAYNPKQLDRAARELDLRLVALHGSRAEGREERDSDIDLAVLAEGAVDSERRLQIYQRLGEVITGAPLDISLLNGAQPTFLEVVAETGVPLYQIDENEFLRFRAKAMSMFADAAKWQEAQRALLEPPEEDTE
jgi:predicted nucleotidyltransferase